MAWRVALAGVLIGWLIAPWLSALLPALVSLEWPTVLPAWAWDRRAVVLAVGLTALPLGWLALVEWEWRSRCPAPASTAPLAACLLVVLAVAVTGHDRGRWFLLEAVKVRAEPFSYPRSVAYWKAESLAHRQLAERRPQVLLLGSSQMNFAVDEQALTDRLPGVTVRKKVLPGFSAMNYAQVVPDLALKRGDTVVCWLSEFDFYREETLPANRIRPFATPGTQPGLLAALGGQAWANRGELADLWFAALLEPWALRDLYRVLAGRFWWRGSAAPGALFEAPERVDRDRQRQNLAASVRPGRLVEANFAVFERFVRELNRRGVRLLVYEGQTHPISREAYDPAFRTRTRQRLAALADAAGYRFIDQGELPRFEADEFADLYHLGPAARAQFTALLAATLESGR